MGKIVSLIPSLVVKSGMNKREFIGRCFAEGLSLDTGQKLVDGETNISAATLAVAARILGVNDLGELMNFDKNGDH